MPSDRTTSRLLGAAFLLQAIASAISGLFLLGPLVVSGDIAETMTNIANNPLQMRASIVFHMITAMGIVMLGALLFLILKKQDMRIALVAFGLYLLEAGLLAASRIPAFSLIQLSQESLMAGHPADLQILGNLLFDAADFGDWLHMLAFSLGASLFYYLFFKSGTIPRILAIWGLIAAPVALIGTLIALFGVDVPLYVFLPNLPFELTMGVWMLVKGIKENLP